eukprot:EC691619.1.p1 GENE.EC691619.1~~EC691619.1.p1  ORF type:complete len:137 (+),score=24.45 EC691619.1:27-413(+)
MANFMVGSYNLIYGIAYSQTEGLSQAAKAVAAFSFIIWIVCWAIAVLMFLWKDELVDDAGGSKGSEGGSKAPPASEASSPYSAFTPQTAAGSRPGSIGNPAGSSPYASAFRPQEPVTSGASPEVKDSV